MESAWHHLSIQLADPGRNRDVRCLHVHDGTVVTLWSPLAATETKTLTLPHSYALMRAVVIRRADYPQFKGVGIHVLLLTRTAIDKTARGYRLSGYLDAIAIDETGLVDLGEKPLGPLAVASTLSAALPIASQLFPLVDDIDRDGWPDVAIADPQSGIASLRS